MWKKKKKNIGGKEGRMTFVKGVMLVISILLLEVLINAFATGVFRHEVF